MILLYAKFQASLLIFDSQNEGTNHVLVNLISRAKGKKHFLFVFTPIGASVIFDLLFCSVMP